MVEWLEKPLQVDRQCRSQPVNSLLASGINTRPLAIRQASGLALLSMGSFKAKSCGCGSFDSGPSGFQRLATVKVQNLKPQTKHLCSAPTCKPKNCRTQFFTSWLVAPIFHSSSAYPRGCTCRGCWAPKPTTPYPPNPSAPQPLSPNPKP